MVQKYPIYTRTLAWIQALYARQKTSWNSRTSKRWSKRSAEKSYKYWISQLRSIRGLRWDHPVWASIMQARVDRADRCILAKRIVSRRKWQARQIPTPTLTLSIVWTRWWTRYRALRERLASQVSKTSTRSTCRSCEAQALEVMTRFMAVYEMHRRLPVR